MEFRDWSDGAVGKQVYITEHDDQIGAVTISGVYKDYRINTLTNQDMRASIKFFGEVGKDYMPYMAIKVSEVTTEMMAKVEEVIQARIENKDVVVKSYKDSTTTSLFSILATNVDEFAHCGSTLDNDTYSS